MESVFACDVAADACVVASILIGVGGYLVDTAVQFAADACVIAAVVVDVGRHLAVFAG